MIHDAKVEVTCDRDSCWSSVYVYLPFVYPDLSGRNGHYDHSDKTVEKRLSNIDEWVVKDGWHFCSEECAEAGPTEGEEDALERMARSGERP